MFSFSTRGVVDDDDDDVNKTGRQGKARQERHASWPAEWPLPSFHEIARLDYEDESTFGAALSRIPPSDNMAEHVSTDLLITLFRFVF